MFKKCVFWPFCPFLQTAIRIFLFFCKRVEDNRAHRMSQVLFLKKVLFPDYRGKVSKDGVWGSLLQNGATEGPFLPAYFPLISFSFCCSPSFTNNRMQILSDETCTRLFSPFIYKTYSHWARTQNYTQLEYFHFQFQRFLSVSIVFSLKGVAKIKFFSYVISICCYNLSLKMSLL